LIHKPRLTLLLLAIYYVKSLLNYRNRGVIPSSREIFLAKHNGQQLLAAIELERFRSAIDGIDSLVVTLLNKRAYLALTICGLKTREKFGDLRR